MKILLVYDVSYPSIEGGGQRRMYEVAVRLAKLGHEVDWLCFKTWQTEIDEQINFIGLPGFKGLYTESGSRRYLEPLEFLFQLWRNRIDYSQYDIIWSGQWPIIHLVFWSFNPKIRSKLVVDWWEVWGRTWFSYSKSLGAFGYLIEKFLIKKVSKKSILVGISEKSVNELRSLSSNVENVRLVHNGIHSNTLEKIANSNDKKYDIAYLGRLKNHKNVDFLIHALNILEKEYKRILYCVIIGHGPEKAKLDSLITKLGLQDRVKIYDNINENTKAYEIISQGRVFVNPSTKEGGGSITLLEAFGLGLPIIAFRAKDGIDPSLIGHPVRGLIVEEFSANALAETLNLAFSSEKSLIDMSEQTKLFAKSFDWDEITSTYLKLFLNISDGSSHG